MSQLHMDLKCESAEELCQRFQMGENLLESHLPPTHYMI